MHSFSANVSEELLDLFDSRSYASLQLVEALAYASSPTTVVELSQETPFQCSYSVINKVLNAFGAESLIPETIQVGESVKTVRRIDSGIFSKITEPFSNLFLRRYHRKRIAHFVYLLWRNPIIPLLNPLRALLFHPA
jgi:hypothetical protein